MGWQSELRQLDREFSSGQIGHADYRKRRDEMLAAAAGSGPTSPETAVATQRAQPVPVPADRAIEWHSTNPAQRTAAVETEVTEPAPAVPEQSDSAKLIANAPTVAPSPADDRNTDALGFLPITVSTALPSERRRHTESLDPRPRYQADLPPSPRAQPEGTARGNKVTWLFLSVAIFLASATIAGAAWWLGAGDRNLADGTAMAADNLPPSSALPLAVRLPDLPGKSSPHNSTMSIKRGVELGIYTSQGAAMIKASGASKVVYHSSAAGRYAYTVVVIPTKGSDAAARLLAQLQDASVEQGAVRKPLGSGYAFWRSSPTGLAGASWYRSDRRVVGVSVAYVGTAPPSDREALEHNLTSTLDSVTAVLQPG